MRIDKNIEIITNYKYIIEAIDKIKSYKEILKVHCLNKKNALKIGYSGIIIIIGEKIINDEKYILRKAFETKE